MDCFQIKVREMGLVLIIAGAVPLFAYGLYCAVMRTVKARCHCVKDLTGKTVIVTGSDKSTKCSVVLELHIFNFIRPTRQQEDRTEYNKIN